MPDRQKALIAGATGVVGRNLLRHLLTLDDWDVIAASRRKPDVEGRYEHVAVDLLDRAQTFEALKRPRGVTHVFFSAYIERPTGAEMVAPNQTMLVNLMDAIEPASPDLAHVNLMHGTKWYGNHLGPFKTPAKEDDPRHMPPNFYYDQQDLVAARQQSKSWTWSTARPHAICVFATGNPMNLVMVLAVYATISKALGMPLRHPGTQENYHALYQCTDTGGRNSRRAGPRPTTDLGRRAIANLIRRRFPLAVAAVSALPGRSFLIDGEAICTDDNGLAVFELIRRARHGDRAVLCVFDLIELDGQDLRRLPIEQRKMKLARLVRDPHPGIVLNAHYQSDGSIIFREACKLGCEGIVSKRLGSLGRAVRRTGSRSRIRKPQP